MKTLVTGFFFIILSTQAFSQTSIVGKWQTIDDETNAPKSIVEITERGGKYFGKITKLFRQKGEDPDPSCTECDSDDPRYNKKVMGMEILKDLKKDGSEYSGGTILDPKNGKVYKCKIWLEDGDLKLRGYIGPFFRTQTWKKVS